MHCQAIDKSKHREMAELFTCVFSSSEGEKEGRLIGNLALELALHIDNDEIICFAAYENDLLIAAIFFTRLKFVSPVQVYMLAPVAVRTNEQGKGIGQAVINYGLEQLKQRGIEIVVTYGDPAFYSKVGFQPLSENLIQAPFKLSMPFGWQGQSLTAKPIPTIKERPRCMKQFNHPDYW